ncbi:MutS protein msh4 [Exophiala xenobiotica]|uniref:MutS protein msh4 n=1 Tax=Lithohypha guttulata TaxID=1690604 RepID=A0ABR0KNE1_9EURO|nr:MutS protein msh4 [Lithohypha guttulata]KAK5329203.1 MutS protein msh4 [Exophiala xenobiotica]
MIDLSTIANLELVQNLQNAKSKHCLFGLLNETSTRMGARLLKNNVLQPSTDRAKIEKRWAAVNELSTKEELFFSLREELKRMVDTDRALANKLDFQYMEQSVNNVLMLKSFIDSIKPIWQGLAGACSEKLQNIKELCDPDNYADVQELIEYALSPDVSYSQNATDLRNHRVFAIRAGTNGFLDVARQSYNEFIGDARDLIEQLQEQHEIPLELKYDTARQFYIRIKANELESGTDLPGVFVNVFRKGKFIECQTLDLIKYNQKIKDAHNEIIAMSDSSVQELIAAVRTNIHPLFKISEGLALLDLLASFAHLATTLSYVRPDVSAEALAIKSSRHPIREKIQKEKYVANDVYATQHHKRFQVVTGCNMSGKSTYIRSIALMTIMAQIGSFVPAEYASFPITCQLFARVATDDCIEANVSTFASEMREMAFILRNIEPQSLVIVDELGRGTSTTDGLAIAIAISEALIESKTYVWFVTHFRDLPRILAERVGVYSMHMGVDIDPDFSRMRMRYKVSEGWEEQKFYGLALAQIIDLPEQVMEMAVAASKELNARNDTRQGSLKPLTIAKRRKLVVHMRETIKQAKHGELENTELLLRMQSLQREFLVRMAAIDAEVAAIKAPPALSPEAEGTRECTPELESDTVSSDQARNEDCHVTNEESSWDASVNHENPLFRPMPTNLKVEETSISRMPRFVKNGNRLDDPICIEDDTSTTSGD